MRSNLSSRVHSVLQQHKRTTCERPVVCPTSRAWLPRTTHHPKASKLAPNLQNLSKTPSFHLCYWVGLANKSSSTYFSIAASRFLNTSSSSQEIVVDTQQKSLHNSETDEEVEPIDTWEEEDEGEPEIGDGGDGGGVVLQNCPWGERALSLAHEVLLQFGNDMELFAFKTSPRGYIYLRLDKLSNEYGCPSMAEMESYSQQYKKKLDELGATGEMPNDLAFEVSSPGAERLLKAPDDLDRFKDMPMRVTYIEDVDAGSTSPEKNGVFFLESIDTESGSCVWSLADVKENRDPSSKGRPLSRKQKDWRLKLPYAMFRRVTLFLDY